MKMKAVSNQTQKPTQSSAAASLLTFPESQISSKNIW